MEHRFEPIFWMQPFPEQVRTVLSTLHVIAIVGLSDDPSRDSYMVGSYLKKCGYTIVPVNPRVPAVLGQKSYPDLTTAAQAVGPIDIVDIFRAPEYIPEVVEDALAIDAKVVWMQLDLVHEAAAKQARDKGLFVVMDRCLKVEHMKYLG